MSIKPITKRSSQLPRKTAIAKKVTGKSRKFAQTRFVLVANLGKTQTTSSCPRGPWKYSKDFLIGMLKGKCLVGNAADDVRLLRYRSAMPVLLNLLKDKNVKSRARASVILAIGRLHAPRYGKSFSAKSAVPTIISYLKSSDADLRRFAATALGDIGDKRGLPALKKFLKTKPKLSERMAAELAVTFIVDAQKEKKTRLKKKRAELVKLYTSSIKDKKVKQAVAMLIGSKDWARRGDGALLLKRIAWMYKKHDEIYNTSDKFKKVLPAIPALVKALEDGEPIVRMHTATALGVMGTAAKRAVPALKRILASKAVYPSVNKEVKKALKKIQAK